MMLILKWQHYHIKTNFTNPFNSQVSPICQEKAIANAFGIKKETEKNHYHQVHVGLTDLEAHRERGRSPSKITRRSTCTSSWTTKTPLPP